MIDEEIKVDDFTVIHYHLAGILLKSIAPKENLIFLKKP